MKKMRNTLAVLLTALLVFACALPAFAAKDMLVFLSVDGISETLYEGSMTVPAGASVLDALKATGLEVVTAEGADGLRVVSIAGDAEKTFGGADGWYYDIGFDDCTVPMDKKAVQATDSIHIYYADLTVGFQKPVMDPALDKGYIRFYSGENTPVAGATMVIDGTYTFVTDADGIVYLPEELCENVHSYTLERYTAQGLPTILRAGGNYGFDPTLGPNLPVASFLSRVIDWFYSLFDKIAAFFRGLVK